MDLNDRPQYINDILINLRHWNRLELIAFLNNFIQNNCDQIKSWILYIDIDLELYKYSDKELKKQIIKLLQNVKHQDNILI